MVKEERFKPKLRFSEFKELWPSDILSNLVTNGFKNGYSPNSPTIPTEHFVLSLSAVAANGFNASGVKYAPDTREVLRTELEYGDFLVTRSNTRSRVGFSAMFRGELERCSYPDLMIRFRPNSQIHPEYLEQTLRSFRVLNYLQSSASGTSGSMVKITGKIIGRALIPLPTLPEQKKIADFLTSVDDRIGQLIKKKALLEDYKKGVMQQLFSQKIRFKDDNGNDFPDWEYLAMEKLYPQIRNGFVGTATPFYCDRGVRYVQGRNIKEGKILGNGFVSITQAFHKKCVKSQLRTNDILMVQSGHVGECAIVTDAFDDANCHALLVLTPRGRDLDSRFYVSFFYSSRGRKIIYKIKTGNTIAHILSSDLKREIAPHPSLPEQTKIADFLTSVDQKIESVSQQIAKTQTFKKGLLQQMFV
jgi:type I restriction enzyme S subunit